MAANTPIDSSITAETLAFYKQLWSTWQAGKHMSAAWLGINQLYVANTTQPEWALYKQTTGHAPAMVCINGQVVWATNGFIPNAFGAANMTLVNNWNGCLPLFQAVTAKGGAVQAFHANGCPATYPAGSTYSGAATTVAAINTLGTLAITATAHFAAGGGIGVLPCADGLHPFTYTGLTTNTSLNGVVIASLTASNINGNVNQSSTAAVAHLAPIYPGLISSQALPGVGLVNATSFATEAWPLHWSSSAYTTLAASQPTGGGISATANGWADAQAVNANGNLNAQLDSFATLCAALSPYPVIMRPLPEPNGGGTFWYDQANITWAPQLFRYIVGYLTGNNGYSGQPVTASPVHNILFAVNPLVVSGMGTIGTSFPTAANVGFVADICGMDVYVTNWSSTVPKSSFTTAQAVTGYSNTPPLLMEAQLQTPAHYAPSAEMFNFSGSPSTGDLSVLTSLTTAPSYDDSVRPFATSGNFQIATSNGVQSVSYSSLAVSGTNPNKTIVFTFTGSVPPAGVPVGSLITVPSLVANAFAFGYVAGNTASNPSLTNATFLTAIKAATAVGGCHFCVLPTYYGGTDINQSQLFLGSFAPVMQDPATVNLPGPGNWSGFGWGAGQGTEWGWSAPLIGA